MGDVGDTELHLLRDILPRCNIKELTHIEYSSEGRDLSPVTDDLWKRFYEQHFGEKNANTVINRMKQKKVVFKWRLLYEAKGKELDEAINRTVKKINAEIQHRKQWNLQIQSCSEDPLSEKKRGHGEASQNKTISFKVVRIQVPEMENQQRENTCFTSSFRGFSCEGKLCHLFISYNLWYSVTMVPRRH
ncbi:unnamed protein product [Musa hybrid cultivar]